MKLFKIILVFFLIYFIRRFLQMYRVMKTIQKQRSSEGQSPKKTDSGQLDTIEADFKVMD